MSAAAGSVWPCVVASGLMGVFLPDATAQESETGSDRESSTGEGAPREMTPPQPGEKFTAEFGIEWTMGPTTAELGKNSNLQIPANCICTGPDGARAQLEAWGNLTDGNDLAMVSSLDEELGWSAVFEFDDCGKVDDSEKEELDPDDLLDKRREMNEAANQEKMKLGLDPLTIVGWAVPPHYDEKTNNLEQGITLENASGHRSVNYEVNLLGRYGVMQATLLCDPLKLDDSLAQFRELIATHEFREGSGYAEWKEGDPIAEYGLTALALGGAAAAAWKFGLLGKLAKFAKVIIVGALAVIGGIWKWLTGRKSATPDPQQYR